MKSTPAVQVQWAKDAAAELGLTIEEKAISASSEVQQAANSLNVDAFYVPTDNAVVSALEGLLQTAQDKKIPVISADGESVKRGATATYGINYEKLGEQTAAMAVKILKGEAKPETMPVETTDRGRAVPEHRRREEDRPDLPGRHALEGSGNLQVNPAVTTVAHGGRSASSDRPPP